MSMPLRVDNTGLLRTMLEDGAIRLVDAPRLWEAPPPLPKDLDWDRVEGMLLGLAIGDALGNGSELLSPAQRFAEHGEITGYIRHKRNGWEEIGTPSDDSQLAFWMLEALLEDGGLVPANVADRYSSRKIIYGGRSVRAFVWAYRSGQPWHQAATDSARNGGVMRIAPILVPHLRTGTAALWADAALAAMITHNSYASNAACVAFVGMLWQLLAMDSVPDQDWWAGTFCDAMAELEGDCECSTRPGAGRRPYTGPVSKYVRDCVAAAFREGLTCAAACDSWHSGSYLLETLPSVIYILARYGSDPGKAMVRAVNDARDNDTVGAIVGAAVGALHGASELPPKWRGDLTGRTRGRNDGQIQALVAQARQAFWD